METNVVNPGNQVEDATDEDTPEKCGERCDSIANCHSFGFCQEPEGFASCYPFDRILTGAEEVQSDPPNCASYQRIQGKHC